MHRVGLRHAHRSLFKPSGSPSVYGLHKLELLDRSEFDAGNGTGLVDLVEMREVQELLVRSNLADELRRIRLEYLTQMVQIVGYAHV